MANDSPTNAVDLSPPIRNIVVGSGSAPQRPQQQGVVVDTTFHRAVHKIRLSALSHNYSEVESAANRQKCSVIVVVKADGYGHGAIPSAIFLADKIGADAFAVATLEVSFVLTSFHHCTTRSWIFRLCISHLNIFLCLPFCFLLEYRTESVL